MFFEWPEWNIQEKGGSDVASSFVVWLRDTPSKNSHAGGLSNSREEHDWSMSDAVDEGDWNQGSEPVFKSIYA